MEALTERVQNLISELYPPHGLWRKPLQWPELPSQVLQAIGDSGEAKAIPFLLPFIFNPSRDTAQAAVEAIHRLVSALPLEDWLTLDLLLRESSVTSIYGGPWNNLTADDIAGLERFGEAALSILGFGSSHSNGFVREAVVKQLALCVDGQELKFLLMRLSDWVPQVRNAAWAAVKARIVPAYAIHFATALPLLLGVFRRGRVDRKMVEASVLGLLAQPDSAPALREALNSPSRVVRRICYRLALAAPSPETPALIAQGLRDEDAPVRFEVAVQARKTLDAEPLRALLPIMKRDATMRVRREALMAVAEKLPELAPLELKTALLDDHVLMRETARVDLKRFERIVYADFYRAALASGDEKTLAGAISGLGETGGDDDAIVVMDCLRHPRARVRRAALAALAALAGDAFIPEFLAAVADERSSVSRRAADVLRPRLRLVEPEQLWAVFEMVDTTHARWNFLELMGRLGEWRSLPLLLRAITSEDKMIANEAEGLLSNALRRLSYLPATPSQAELERVRNAFTELQGKLPARVTSSLEHHLAFWQELLQHRSNVSNE